MRKSSEKYSGIQLEVNERFVKSKISSMIRSIKRCLRKTLGKARFAIDELVTVLVGVEGTLNDRPLTYVYNEVGKEVLTPSHFLYFLALSLFF